MDITCKYAYLLRHCLDLLTSTSHLIHIRRNNAAEMHSTLHAPQQTLFHMHGLYTTPMQEPILKLGLI
jgi:hypothetical protein